MHPVPSPGAQPAVRKPLPAHLVVRQDNVAESRWESMWDGEDQLSDTPTDRFFVRNHTATPLIDAATWRLKLYGSGLQGAPDRTAPITLDYAELRALPSTTERILLECTGNGRSLFVGQQGDPAPPGTSWGLGAIGTATWTGVPLRTLLEHAGITAAAVSLLPIGLDGDFFDEGVHNGPVRRPLPIAKAMDDVLVAYEMNGEPLLPDHGFPARLVVPDWVGIASIKWLGEIEVSTTPLHSPWDTTYYFMDGEPLTELIPKSVLELGWNAVLRSGEPHRLRGRAWSGSDKIISVEVSVDAGKSWQQAQLTDDGAWVRWQFDWCPGADDRGPKKIMSRATDAAGRRQPDRTPRNPRGYLFGAVVQHPVMIS